ncbi:serine hydrolase domain-containing protein [Flavivirga abyssicola]|uniref:serine hydrolase domain-containing protein n=1 Tax=Flavivirga abyssicola TaxID=3063533 RepID=UPI0026E10E7D|nr:serine hydrolase domain-containing protein [Flavivirga sp. MEBiC07777]WVK12351.1 serine hydrolase domain-containing protein [Flavivirga sp. MEBiC07777]
MISSCIKNIFEWKFLMFCLKFNVCFVLVFLVGCNKDLELEEVSNYKITLISGNNQIGFQNTTLLEDIVVKVEDELGASASGIALNVELVSESGEVNNGASIITNEEGLVSISWKLGSNYNNILKVFSGSNQSSSVSVSAIAKYKYTIPESVNDGWNSSDVTALLPNANKLYDGIDEIRNENYKEIHSVLLSVNNNLVFEEYFAGTNSFGEFIDYDKNKPHELQSVNKSFRGAMIGIAIDKGFITSDQVPLKDFFPELSYLSQGGKENILLEHFLAMSSGLEWNEGTDLTGFYGTPFETAHTYVLSKALENTPGSTFEYNTGASFVLNRIMMNSIHVGFEVFAKDYYSDLVESSALPGTGEPLDFRNTPRDMLKLGQVYLNDGKWKDTQVISKAWIDESTKVKFNVSSNSSYGYQWWIRNFNTGVNTYNCFYAAGFGGQYIFVIKELGLVAVFTGGNFNSDMNIPYEIMENYILPAFVE